MNRQFDELVPDMALKGNPCLNTLLKFLVIGFYSKQLRDKSKPELQQHITDLLNATRKKKVEGDHDRKLFYSPETQHFVHEEALLNQLVKILPPEFGYASLADFENANGDDTAEKYEYRVRSNAKRKKYTGAEVREIREWAENKCKEHFERLKIGNKPSNENAPSQSKNMHSVHHEKEKEIRETLHNYLQKKLDDFDYIYLEFAKEETKINLKDIPVPHLLLQNQFPDEVKSENIIPAFAIEEEVEIEDRLLVVAEGGKGKTTICKWLFNSYASRFDNSELSVFPIYIKLTRGLALDTFLPSVLGASKFSYNELKAILNTITPLFIVDGLDELYDNVPPIISDIINISENFPQSKVFITSRPGSYINDFISKGYNQYTLKLNETDDIARHLIKDDMLYLYFQEHVSNIQLADDIKSNYLLYTYFILIYIKTGGQQTSLTRASLLTYILEDYYIRKWELANKEDRSGLPHNLSYIPDILSIIAFIIGFKNKLCDYVKDDFPFFPIIEVNEDGISAAHIKLIIESRYGKIGHASDRLIQFFNESGMLNISQNGNYLFQSITFASHFLARGIARICLEPNEISLFRGRDEVLEKLTSALWSEKFGVVGMLERKDFFAINVAGFLKYPEQFLSRLYKNYEIDKIFNNTEYIKMLSFAATIIRVRQTEIALAVKLPILQQLIACTKLQHFSSKKRQAGDSTLGNDNFLNILLLTDDEIAFEVIWEYFLMNEKYIESDYLMVLWTYFRKWERDEILQFSLTLEFKGNHPIKNTLINQWKLCYLNQYASDKMILLYTKLLKYSKKYNKILPFFEEQIPVNYFCLWKYVAKNRLGDSKLLTAINCPISFINCIS